MNLLSRSEKTLVAKNYAIQINGNDKDNVIGVNLKKSRRLLRGGEGNDTLRAGFKDYLKGGAGDDRLDATQGKGKNSLLGGQGTDQLFANRRDFLGGGSGADVLWAGNGRNRLRGDRGRDLFWIADGKSPAQANWIEDFKVSVDRIGIQNLSGVRKFSDLDLVQKQNRTIVRFEGRDLAILIGVDATDLSAQDFNLGAIDNPDQPDTPTVPDLPANPSPTPEPEPEPVFIDSLTSPISKSSLFVDLLNDSGTSSKDQITRFPDLIVAPTRASTIIQLSASFVNEPSQFVDISSVLKSEDFFILTRSQLTNINRSALTDGSYTIYFKGVDESEQKFYVKYSFVLDSLS
jgi:hypothetical protein